MNMSYIDNREKSKAGSLKRPITFIDLYQGWGGEGEEIRQELPIPGLKKGTSLQILNLLEW